MAQATNSRDTIQENPWGHGAVLCFKIWKWNDCRIFVSDLSSTTSWFSLCLSPFPFFPFFFLDPVLDFILLSVSKFYLLKQFSCGKRTLLSFQVLTRNFPLYENNIFQELEHVWIFEVFPRKGEKRTCDKMSLPCQTALPKTWVSYKF